MTDLKSGPDSYPAQVSHQATDQALASGQWLVFIYRLPSETSSARSALWRETRRLGALSLQHGVCLLPFSQHHQQAYSRLLRRVEDYGGEAMVLETRSPDPVWEDRVTARFNQARNEEYDEVVDEAERFREEIERKRRKGKYTFAELENDETKLERLHKYLGQVQGRDLFGAPGRARAIEEVEGCDEELNVFAQEIYECQAGPVEPGPPGLDGSDLRSWLVRESDLR